MNKSEFMRELTEGLKKRKVPELDEITEEYERHFAYKAEEGFSEEEIAARLGDPAALACQFEGGSKRGGRKIAAACWLAFADVGVGAFLILLAAWWIVLCGLALASAALSVCLFGGFNLYELIPPTPYWCGEVFALAAAALAVLAGTGCVYFAAFLRQMARSFARFQRNTLAAAGGGPVLPPLTAYPRFAPVAARRIKAVGYTAAAAFAACFMLGMIAASLSAGTIQFWHAWGWFGYAR